MIPAVADAAFFNAQRILPRGRHSLGRELVLAVQRERIMIAIVELMAAHGYHGFGVGEIATHAGVSRGAFYDCFASKEACAFAAYDRFIEVLLTRIAERTATTGDWDSFVEALLGGYLDTLAQDVVVARAFQVELDAIGAPARARRRQALERFATHISEQQERLASDDRSLKAMAPEAYLGAVYAIRQVASDLIDNEADPDLRGLIGALGPWVAESFRAGPVARRPFAGPRRGAS